MESQILQQKKICIIGAGAMGGALARGLINSGVINHLSLSIADPALNPLEDVKEKGVKITTDNIAAMKDTDLVVIAVKPWIVKSVIEEIKSHLKASQEICFILASVSGEDLKEMFADTIPSNLSIAMPNTAMSVGESMTFIVSVSGNPSLAFETFNLVGKTMIIPPRLLPGAMALASCGIAYAMRYVRAACEGGVELGFKASEAKKIVSQTLLGAVRLLENPDSHPETEIDKVTTPGGITIKGLNAMERAGFTNAVIEGLKISANA